MSVQLSQHMKFVRISPVVRTNFNWRSRELQLKFARTSGVVRGNFIAIHAKFKCCSYEHQMKFVRTTLNFVRTSCCEWCRKTEIAAFCLLFVRTSLFFPHSFRIAESWVNPRRSIVKKKTRDEQISSQRKRKNPNIFIPIKFFIHPQFNNFMTGKAEKYSLCHPVFVQKFPGLTSIWFQNFPNIPETGIPGLKYIIPARVSGSNNLYLYFSNAIWV